MSTVPRAETVKRFRQATGMGWMAAKLFLAGRSDELCERILRAHQEQNSRPLHDPIEDDPEFKERVAAARDAAEQDHRAWIAEDNRSLQEAGREREISEWRRGSCFRIWKLMKEDLSQAGISWYSPADMNPDFIFD
jgi:hypothetical protein